MTSEEFNFFLQLLAMLGSAFCGFLAGREWRKKHFDQQLLKETYEKGKLDGVFDFIQRNVFADIFKHRLKNADSADGNKKSA